MYDHIDFSKPLEEEFWKKFPRRNIPEVPTTRINVDNLAEMVHEEENRMTDQEREMANKAISILREGAPALQMKEMLGAVMKNAPSINKCAASFTETLHKWIEGGFVAGPFMEQPLEGFRSNSLMAEEQKEKIKPVLNMSNPKGKSFNDNVDQLALGRSTMSSAKMFGQSLKAAGRGAIMSKMDMKDAYKLIPARTEDFRLQGFCWKDAYFVETQQIFGATTAVNNFDVVAKTIQLLARLKSKIPKHLVQQTLDDTACTSPEKSGWCEQFTSNYKGVCQRVNIELAKDCPKREKAFTNTTVGTVLGIRFDSRNMTWSLPPTKVSDILADIHVFLTSKHASLKQTQQLAGRLNNMGQMLPFMKGFKRPLNKLLAEFQDDENIILPIREDLMADLRIWAAATCQSGGWLPIPDGPQLPPISSLMFTSDAAGGTGAQDWAGVASLGHTPTGEIWFMCRGQWPKNILTDLDEKGAAFKSKMTTLELVGLMLPFLTIPDAIRGRHVVLGVDNRSVVHAWQNKSAKGDMSASVLVRALLIVTSFLE